MARIIICSVGTSLLTNRDDRPWSGWTHRENPPLPTPESVSSWLKTADATKVSAESHTLHKMGIDRNDQIEFLLSDTAPGRYCGDRLAEYYIARKHFAATHQIGQLGYGAQQFSAGLKSLVSIATNLISQARAKGDDVVICATGGFKAQMSYLNLIGALLRVEVAYLHEDHATIVRLPRLPLEWDTGFVLQNRHFFDWIDEDCRSTTEVEPRLLASPALRTLVEESEDGNTYLSPAGSLLFAAAKEAGPPSPRAVWPQMSDRHPEEKNQISRSPHHRPNGWEAFVKKLCRIDCVTSVRYEELNRNHIPEVIDAEAGAIRLVYFVADETLPLRIETTARGQQQTELVMKYLERIRG